MAKIDQILRMAAKVGASDVHIAVGNPPIYRHLGDLKKFKAKELSPSMTKALIHEILTPEMRQTFERDLQLDFSYEIEGTARFRVNIFHQRLGVDASFRVVPFRIPPLDSLGLPAVTTRILDHHQGLILVTGTAGHGKSTTLAAMVDHLNTHKPHHILTVEDPIEFVHSIEKKGVVNQRQVGRDTRSFANALKGALREDPDIIVIGELRDRETTSLAMTAAETGHLVISTMSTSSAHKTIDRIIDSFPPEEQNQVRTMLADSIKGIITQRLIKDAEGKGRCLATEVLVGTRPIASVIRDCKTYQMPSMIQTGKKVGMELMDESLLRLLREKRITAEAAYENAVNRKLFQSALKKRPTS